MSLILEDNTSILLLYIIEEVLANVIKQEEEIKGYTDWQMRNETVFVCM